MNVDEILSNEAVVMTEGLHRVFNSSGYNPACRNCWKLIPVGSKFKLSTIKSLSTTVWGKGLENAIKLLNGVIETFSWNGDVILQTKEVMLCDNCTPDLCLSKTIAQLKENIKKRDKKGCFRVNGKIVH